MIRLRDGIRIETNDTTVVLDASRPNGDINIVSHGHTDHLPRKEATIVCSSITGALAETRMNTTVSIAPPPENITLLPAGHVLGSRAALIDLDKRYLYTGDVSTRSRFYLDGFEPVEADVLIIESTYGRPAYTFPDQRTLERTITNWIDDNEDRPLFLFGYPFGRAQKIQYLAHQSRPESTNVHESILAINQVIEQYTDVTFPDRVFDPTKPVSPGDIIVLPTGARKTEQIKHLINHTNGKTAGFSGWAINQRFHYGGRYDASFPLSDHCDFTELVDIVTRVDPEKVFTNHGFDEDFATYLTTELGYEAQPLKRNQTAISDF